MTRATHDAGTGPWLFDARLAHARCEPVDHAFSYRQPMWMINLDHVPALRGPLRALLRFDAADHLGDPHATIRANLDGFLASHGEARPTRVLLLTNPRSLGHTFNPLSVFWCFDAGGSLQAVVAEVHNTYGGRHCYLLHPNAQGSARAGKEMYVSPFFPVDGRYEMQLTDPRERLDVAISLYREERPVFRALLRAGPPRVVRSCLLTALRHPVPAWWVTARIRIQGIRLWRRGVPIAPRPGPALVPVHADGGAR
ncbi:MAG: DUF1365 domain-containing protein [Acidimicrobiia bacterium]